MSRRVVLATRSAAKVREIAPMFLAAGYEVCTLDAAGIPPEPNEDAIEAWETFEENALGKARHFFARAGGLPVVADDSGLESEALGGAPGVRSKRWSGRSDLEGPALDAANNARLLEALAAEGNRRARYVCAAAWVDGTIELVTRGEATGRILTVPRGTAGFGYDPYFHSDALGKTFAEVTREAKEQVSHRGRAFHDLLRQLDAGR